MFELYEVAFEIHSGDRLIQRKIIQAPKELHIGTFLRMAQSIANDSRPMQIKMIRPESIWDPFEQTNRILNNEIVLTNRAMEVAE